MKYILINTVFLFLTGLLFFVSCKKEYSCEGCREFNKLPIAVGGPDQIITLPIDSILLDGSASKDPDGTIASFLWTKISGPSPFNITNPNNAKTAVKNLVAGVYLFELKVTDDGGLFSKDSIQIIVHSETPQVITCDNNNRPLVYAQVISLATLSENRYHISVVSAGNKILFAGGLKTDSYWEPSSRVDIHDIITQTWVTAELSVPRYGMATVAAGNKIFFAGGAIYDDADNWIFYSTVDIYDVVTNSWTTATLSEPRGQIAAATVGDNVYFASGWKKDSDKNSMSDKLDIYNLKTNTWSIQKWNVPRGYMTAITINDKIYFAGGKTSDSVSKQIDIYDNLTNMWSKSSLIEPKTAFAGIVSSDKIYWAGGYNGFGLSCSVEINDLNTGNSTMTNLFKPGEWRINNGENSVQKDNKIVFLRQWPYSNDQINSPKQYFDIYDIGTGAWSIGVLPQSFIPTSGSIISVNNTIYVTSLWNSASSTRVWKLEF